MREGLWQKHRRVLLQNGDRDAWVLIARRGGSVLRDSDPIALPDPRNPCSLNIRHDSEVRLCL